MDTRSGQGDASCGSTATGPAPGAVLREPPAGEDPLFSARCGAASSAASGAAEGDPAGPEAVARLAAELQALRSSIGLLIAARYDQFKLTLRRAIFFAVLAAAAAGALVAIVASACVMLVVGMAGGLSQAIGSDPWVGQLLTGAVLIGGGAVAGFVGIRAWKFRALANRLQGPLWKTRQLNCRWPIRSRRGRKRHCWPIRPQPLSVRFRKRSSGCAPIWGPLPIWPLGAREISLCRPFQRRGCIGVSDRRRLRVHRRARRSINRWGPMACPGTLTARQADRRIAVFSLRSSARCCEIRSRARKGALLAAIAARFQPPAAPADPSSETDDASATDGSAPPDSNGVASGSSGTDL